MKAIKVAARKPKQVFFTSTVTLTVSLSFTLHTDLFNNLNGCIHLNHSALLRLPSSFFESPSIMLLSIHFQKSIPQRINKLGVLTITTKTSSTKRHIFLCYQLSCIALNEAQTL